MTPSPMKREERPDAYEDRIREIVQALKRDPDRAYRRQLVREFLDLTDPQKETDL